jgi:methyltransferase
MNLLLLVTLAFVPMLLEVTVSRRNERELRTLGATEPEGDVYRLMQLAYPVAFLAMLIEGWLRGGRVDTFVAAGFALFVGAKLLKYWAIASLGPRWTFRVLVPPGSSLVVLGPYRMLRHPNYLAVMGELVGGALIARAPITGACAAVGFGLLIRRRVIVEERALGLRTP